MDFSIQALVKCLVVVVVVWVVLTMVLPLLMIPSAIGGLVQVIIILAGLAAVLNILGIWA